MFFITKAVTVITLLFFFVRGHFSVLYSSSSIRAFCSASEVLFPIVQIPRPDRSDEEVLWNEEVITGGTCFSLVTLPNKRRNTVHVSVLRYDNNEFCRGLIVHGVEILALAHSNSFGLGQNRFTFGSWRREDLTFLTSQCEANGQELRRPLRLIHANYTYVNLSVTVWDDCLRQNSSFNPASESSSIRFHTTEPRGLSDHDVRVSIRVVACGVWSYRGINLTYPTEFTSTTELFLTFLAELDVVGPNNEKLFRSLAKVSHETVIKKLPALQCRSLVTSTTSRTRTTTTCPGYPFPCVPGGSSRPSPRPQFVIAECPAHPTCAIAFKHLKEPVGEVFSSIYISASDACKCRSVNMRTGYTLRKYNYGGLHHGLPTRPSSVPSTVIPPVPVQDVIFGDCLQFYFDTSTACAIFQVDACLTSAPIVKLLELHEFYIFALGSSGTGKSSDVFPFGEWETVDNSLGNCGNLVNSKATKLRGQLWTRKYTGEPCSPVPSPYNYDWEHAGMPENKDPQVWKVQLDSPLVLQGTSATRESLVYAVRLNTKDFKTSVELHRRQFLGFVLEAYTKIITKYDNATKWQIISMKTPIVEVKYEDHSPDLRLKVTSKVSKTHRRPYFMLWQEWHMKLYKTRSGICPHIMPPTPQQPPPPSDNGLENVCRCFSPLRQTGRRNDKPSSVTDFITDVSPNVKPGSKPITANCFILGVQPETVVPGGGTNPSGGCTGKPPQQRVLVYFGMTCPGTNGLEIMDLILQAQNHKGYPVGFFTTPTLSEQASICKGLLTTKSSFTNWKIRDFRPVSTYICPKVSSLLKNEETFLQNEEPSMTFFNHNLTLYATNDQEYFGFCSWWNYKHIYTYVTSDDRNFYFDYQFVATAYIEHRPSNTQYLVTFRTERLGYNVKTCETDTLSTNLLQRDIYLNSYYYQNSVAEPYSSCLIPLSLIDTFAKGLCGCYIGEVNGLSSNGQTIKVQTHRFDGSIYPTNDPMLQLVEHLQRCIEFNGVLNNQPEEYSVVVSFKLANSIQCLQDFRLYEVLLQALNNHGLPMGTWDPKLIQGGPQCMDAKFLGDAEVTNFKCPISKPHLDYYKTDYQNVNIFHFKNRWMDEHFDWICARWRYPKRYAEQHKPKDLPLFVQFYVQTNVLHVPSGKMITAPKFTIRKVVFESNGNFQKEASMQPFQHIADFNHYLISTFVKGLANNCLIKYPQPPDYASYSCSMFHPSTLKDNDFRVDLYNNDPDNTQTKIYDGCYEFDAFPGNQPLSMHLRFQQNVPSKKCKPVVHLALTAYNEKGLPIGKVGKDTFVHYDHPFVLTNDARYCSGEDITTEQDSVVTKHFKMCPFYPNSASGLDESSMKDHYLQEVTSDSLPGMLAIEMSQEVLPTQGICFHWVYDEQVAGQKTPKYVQFYLELFVPLSKENNVVGTKLLMRSKKFKMNYVAGSPVGSPPQPPKDCHTEIDSHGIFNVENLPQDPWERMHSYTILPDKTTYRRCLADYNSYKACVSKFASENVRPPINPVVVIPGQLGHKTRRYTNRYDSTKAIYNGCVTSKPCFSPLEGYQDYHDCILEMNCELVWSYGKQPIFKMDAHLPDPEENDEIVLELYGWAAMALSTDRYMGQDPVFECVKKNVTTNTVDYHHSWNFEIPTKRTKHENERFPDDVGNHIARLVHHTSDNDSVHCIFYVKSSFQARSLKTAVVYNYDLRSDQYCVLTAYSDNFKLDKENLTIIGIASHQKGKRKGHATCKELALLSTRFMPTKTQVRKLQIHGAIMSVTFVGMLTFSVFVARYYKLSMERLIYGYPSWVMVHGIFATMASILICISWVLLSMGKRGWKARMTSPFHKWMGYLSMGIVLINILIGLYIRKTDPIYDRHSVFYLIHGVGGHFALVCGILIIMLSVHVEYAFMPCVSMHFAIAFILFYSAIHVFMSVNRYLLNKCKCISGSRDNRLKDITLTPFILMTQNASPETFWYEEYPKATIVRLVILSIVFLVVSGFSVAFIYLIVTADHSCASEKSKWFDVT